MGDDQLQTYTNVKINEFMSGFSTSTNDNGIL